MTSTSGRRNMRLLVFLGCFIALPTSCDGQSFETLTSEESQTLASSLLTGLLGNNRAIENFDVSISHEHNSFGLNGVGAHMEVRARLLRDGVEGKQLGVWLTRIDRRSDDEQIDTNRSVRALMASGQNNYFVALRGKVAEVGRETWQRMLPRFQWPNFESLSLRRFPDSNPGSAGGIEYWDAAIASGATLSAQHLQSGDIQVDHATPLETGGDILYRWVFSPQTMMPKSVVIRIRYEEDDNFFVSQRTVFQWQKIGAVYVPTQITRSERQKETDSSGKEWPYEVTDDFEFRWNTLNESIESFEFTKKALLELKPDEFVVQSATQGLAAPEED
ncbi:hypothetical protein [Crateriforma conspicua]|uniref:hypothetical protein n=1 Tax=Crateriforma conspicua TaxID=2527996 RepID=UPI0011A08FD3|nr:hypothetical protein [Crateriforma conspicua]